MSTTPRVTRVADFDPDVPEYVVSVDGIVIGTVARGWFRNGGVQWTNSVRGSLYPVAPTRAEAVAHLVRETS